MGTTLCKGYGIYEIRVDDEDGVFRARVSWGGSEEIEDKRTEQEAFDAALASIGVTCDDSKAIAAVDDGKPVEDIKEELKPAPIEEPVEP